MINRKRHGREGREGGRARRELRGKWSWRKSEVTAKVGVRCGQAMRNEVRERKRKRKREIKGEREAKQFFSSFFCVDRQMTRNKRHYICAFRIEGRHQHIQRLSLS